MKPFGDTQGFKWSYLIDIWPSKHLGASIKQMREIMELLLTEVHITKLGSCLLEAGCG